jgi:GT2 family glycosyltransferase
LNRPTISIVTPWRDQIQFIPGYLQAVKGADEVHIVDGGCSPEGKRCLLAAFGSMVHFKCDPWSFSAACNAGLKRCTADIVVMLNNDVRATGPWLDYVRAQVKRDTLYGPELLTQHVPQAGMVIPFLSGWCVGARREVWEELGGFDDATYQRGYWEDNDLSFRAMAAGMNIVRADWPIEHLAGPDGRSGNNTAVTHPDYYADVDKNRASFTRRVLSHVFGELREPTAEGVAA